MNEKRFNPQKALKLPIHNLEVLFRLQNTLVQVLSIFVKHKQQVDFTAVCFDLALHQAQFGLHRQSQLTSVIYQEI